MKIQFSANTMWTLLFKFKNVSKLKQKSTYSHGHQLHYRLQLLEIGRNKRGPHGLKQNLRWDFSQILEMLPQWRHNGFFDVLRWGTLTPSIFVQFSSNWHMLLFNSWLCMGLQSSVFGSYLLSEMTVGKTVKNQSDVKFKTTFLFL